MGILTRVYKLNGDLAINIPSEALPDSSLQLIEERIETPGYEAETEGWYDAIIRPYKNRTAVLLTSDINISPAEAMSNLGLDPDKPIYLKPYGANIWIRAHFYHGYYGRVWIPTPIARKTRMRNYTVYPFLIRGTTFPKIEIRHIRKEVRNVYIEHMGKTYPADNYAPNRYRWIIPKELESYPVLLQGFKMIPPSYPLGEVHRTGSAVFVDFYYYPEQARPVSQQIGYAYRNMAVRNYTASATVDLGYPFLCELRATYLSSIPKTFYQIKERAVYEKGALTLKQALETTVYNMLQFFFPPAKDEYKYSCMSWAEHHGTIDFTTERIDLQRKYPKLNNVPKIIAEGEKSSETWNITEYPYYKAIKYVRIIGKWAYKNQNFTRGIYLNDDVERVLYQIEDTRVSKGLPARMWIDEKGFVWRA